MFPLQNIFDALVHVVATFGAAVLSHPAMQSAAADAMVLGEFVLCVFFETKNKRTVRTH